MMAVTLIVPITRMVDSFLIINILSKYLSNATAVYGLYSGAVESIIGMPISICYAFAITIIPIVSKAKKQGEKYHVKSLQAVGYTLVFSLAFSIMLFTFSRVVVSLLYSGLNAANKEIVANMLKLSSISVLLLPVMQTLNASINAMGSYKITIFSGLISSAIKIILSIQFLKIENISIFGAILSDIFCYLVACFINLGYIIYSGFIKNKNSNSKKVQNV